MSAAQHPGGVSCCVSYFIFRLLSRLNLNIILYIRPSCAHDIYYTLTLCMYIVWTFIVYYIISWLWHEFQDYILSHSSNIFSSIYYYHQYLSSPVSVSILPVCVAGTIPIQQPVSIPFSRYHLFLFFYLRVSFSIFFRNCF